MFSYPVYDLDAAPEASKAALSGLQKTFGMIPNIAGVMAGSPVLLNGFVPLFTHVHAGTFSEAQIQTLLLTNAVTNQSTWPVAFHSALALGAGVAPADVQALRARRSPTEPKLAALSGLARSLIEKRGRLDERDLRAFDEAGFVPSQVLEVIAVVAASTITNYTANVGQPALEPQFRAHSWHA